MSSAAQNVSVLFARSDSIYKEMGLDCWDAERDATKYPGENPVVAHPPCRAWGRLRHMAKPRPGEKELALFAVDMVRKYGGVLEHPRNSGLWPDVLPLPGQQDSCGGYSISIDQSWFGHKAKKDTLLYIVGCSKSDLPSIPISFDAIQYVVNTSIRKSSGRQALKHISKKEREATPAQLAVWLVEVAARCKVRK